MKKKKIALALSLLLTASLFGGCGSQSASSSSDEIKIGVIMPLTGSVAAFGQSGQKGLQLLQDETNNAGGINGKKVKFIFQDDEGKAASSANAAQKLINDENVVAIIGPLTSTCAISVASIANQNKIPMVTGTATNPKVTKAGDYIFRTCFIDPFQGSVVSKFATNNLKAKTATILYNNGDDYSRGLADAFKSSFERQGGKVVESETYSTGDQDFSAQLTKLKSKNSDVMFLPDYYSTVGVIAKQARSLGIKATFLGGDGWDSPGLFSIGGNAVNGSYFSDHYSAQDTSQAVVNFVKTYKAKYKETPDAMAALNYDAGKVLLASIKNAGKTDSDSIKNALENINVNVVSGSVKVDKDRNAIKAAVILKANIKDNNLQFVTKIQP